MNFTNILILSALVSFLGFLAIYSASPKKFELKIIDNELMALLYSTYFFFPFTIKIRKYKNMKGAYIRRRVERSRYSKYFVYDLVLELSKRSITLLRGKREDKELSKHRDNINKSIMSFKEYSFDICSGNWKIFIILAMVIVPLIMIISHAYSEGFNYTQDIEFQYFIYVYLSSITIIIVSIILSLTINRLTESKNKAKVMSLPKYNIEKKIKEENRDINSEAQKIYDSIIK